MNNNRKLIKVPMATQRSLLLDGVNIVDSCTNIAGSSGSMFLKEHLLLFVTKGAYFIRFGEQEITICKNQMVLLKKSIVIEYQKLEDSDSGELFEGMMFFLKDHFLEDFVKQIDVPRQESSELAPISVKDINKQLLAFIHSLTPYFTDPNEVAEGLIKLKIMELLYGIARMDQNLLAQLLQLKTMHRRDISQVLEENFMNPVTINDLAYLSGRSLSSFKRDFKAMYNTPPAKWLQKRRLEKAKELLSKTEMSVTNVCYITGFESLSHFSKVYKSYYGHSPSMQKQDEPNRQII